MMGRLNHNLESRLKSLYAKLCSNLYSEKLLNLPAPQQQEGWNIIVTEIENIYKSSLHTLTRDEIDDEVENEIIAIASYRGLIHTHKEEIIMRETYSKLVQQFRNTAFDIKKQNNIVRMLLTLAQKHKPSPFIQEEVLISSRNIAVDSNNELNNDKIAKLELEQYISEAKDDYLQDLWLSESSSSEVESEIGSNLARNETDENYINLQIALEDLTLQSDTYSEMNNDPEISTKTHIDKITEYTQNDDGRTSHLDFLRLRIGANDFIEPKECQSDNLVNLEDGYVIIKEDFVVQEVLDLLFWMGDTNIFHMNKALDPNFDDNQQFLSPKIFIMSHSILIETLSQLCLKNILDYYIDTASKIYLLNSLVQEVERQLMTESVLETGVISLPNRMRSLITPLHKPFQEDKSKTTHNLCYWSSSWSSLYHCILQALNQWQNLLILIQRFYEPNLVKTDSSKTFIIDKLNDLLDGPLPQPYELDMEVNQSSPGLNLPDPLTLLSLKSFLLPYFNLWEHLYLFTDSLLYITNQATRIGLSQYMLDINSNYFIDKSSEISSVYIISCLSETVENSKIFGDYYELKMWTYFLNAVKRPYEQHLENWYQNGRLRDDFNEFCIESISTSNQTLENNRPPLSTLSYVRPKMSSQNQLIVPTIYLELIPLYIFGGYVKRLEHFNSINRNHINNIFHLNPKSDYYPSKQIDFEIQRNKNIAIPETHESSLNSRIFSYNTYNFKCIENLWAGDSQLDYITKNYRMTQSLIFRIIFDQFCLSELLVCYHALSSLKLRHYLYKFYENLYEDIEFKKYTNFRLREINLFHQKCLSPIVNNSTNFTNNHLYSMKPAALTLASNYWRNLTNEEVETIKNRIQVILNRFEIRYISLNKNNSKKNINSQLMLFFPVPIPLLCIFDEEAINCYSSIFTLMLEVERCYYLLLNLSKAIPSFERNSANEVHIKNRISSIIQTARWFLHHFILSLNLYLESILDTNWNSLVTKLKTCSSISGIIFLHKAYLSHIAHEIFIPDINLDPNLNTLSLTNQLKQRDLENRNFSTFLKFPPKSNEHKKISNSFQSILTLNFEFFKIFEKICLLLEIDVEFIGLEAVDIETLQKTQHINASLMSENTNREVNDSIKLLEDYGSKQFFEIQNFYKHIYNYTYQSNNNFEMSTFNQICSQTDNGHSSFNCNDNLIKLKHTEQMASDLRLQYLYDSSATCYKCETS